MSKFFIARKACGCITGAAIDGYAPHVGEEVTEWLRRGDRVTYEEHKTFIIGSCPAHRACEVAK